MKKIYLLLDLLFVVIISSSCSKEYGPYEYDPEVNFTESKILLKETDKNGLFKVFIYNNMKKVLDAKVSIEGSPIVETGSDSAVYGTDFIVSPAPSVNIDNKLLWELSNFEKDSILFTIIPIHNQLSSKIHKYQLAIKSVSKGLSIGGQSDLTLQFNNVD